MLQYDYIQDILGDIFFVYGFKLLDFCAILIFYSVMFDKVWKEFCVGVIVSQG